MPKVNGKRTVAQREKDREIVSNWFLEGVSYREMAKRINEIHADDSEYPISYKTVHNDAMLNVKRWQKHAIKNVQKRRFVELAKLQKVEEENWKGWKRSLEDAEEIHVELKPKGEDDAEMVDGLFEKERKISKQQSGNPAFLRNIASIIEQRCKLEGLNAPEQVEVKANWAELLKDEHEHAMIDVEANEVPEQLEEAAGDESPEETDDTT